MKRRLNPVLLPLLICCFSFTVFAQPPAKTVATLTGYPAITITQDSVMPTGDTGGMVTIGKVADNLDQKFQAAMNNKTSFATLDIVEYNASGQKTKTYHFTNLTVLSVVANYNGASAVSFKYQNAVY
jgi:hypothetical protein